MCELIKLLLPELALYSWTVKIQIILESEPASPLDSQTKDTHVKMSNFSTRSLLPLLKLWQQIVQHQVFCLSLG